MEIDLGGRKFIFAIMVVLMMFVMAIMQMITYQQFLDGALWALGIFSAANAISKFSDVTITKETKEQ